MLIHKKNPIIFVSIILVVGFLLTSFVSYYVALNELRQNIIHKDLPLSVDSIYLDIRDELQKPIYISSFMAHDTFLRNWTLKGERDRSEITQYLAEIQSHYRTLSSFFISAKTLKYYHPSGRDISLDPNNKEDAWFFRVKDATQEYEVNIDNDYLNSELLTIFINYRMLDENGEFLGVVGVGIEVDVAKKFIDKSSERFNHEIYFLDPEGNIKIRSSNAQNGYESIHRYNLYPGQIKKILSGKSGVYSYYRDGQTRYLTTRFVKDFNWVVMVEQTDEFSKKVILNALVINLLICLVIIFVVVLITNVSFRSYQSALQTAAVKDKLTGLYNRYALDILFEKLLQRINREQSGCSVLLIDIDDFKAFNDQYGHLIGDEVLRHIANILEESFRTYDVICRWGGEEFLVALEGTRLTDAKQMAEVLRDKIEKAQLHFAGLDLSVTVSIGVGQYEPDDSYEAILNRADRALYAAKEAGRNRVVTEPSDDSAGLSD